MINRVVLSLFGLMLSQAIPAPAQRPVDVGDLERVREVSDPQISPDGGWVAYTVSVSDTAKDQDDTDLWLASWDGQQQIRLTRSPANEHAPRWSPDGRQVAFLSNRDDPREVDQVWLLDRAGGEPERVSDLPGGVSDLAWSPDGHRLALIASDPDPDAKEPGDTSSRAPTPIVIDRFQFKADETGWLKSERDHLYLLDLATRAATQVLRGRVRRSRARLVARRALDRVREPASARVRPNRQLRPLRRRGHGGGRAAAAHHVSRARTRIPSGAAGRRPGAPTAPRSPTCRVVRSTCSTTAFRSWRWCRRPAARRAFSRPRSTGTCSRPPSRTTGRRCCSWWKATACITSRACPRPAARSSAVVEGKRALTDLSVGARRTNRGGVEQLERRRPRSTRWREAATSSGRSRGRTRNGWPRSGSRRRKKSRCGAATAARSTA